MGKIDKYEIFEYYANGDNAYLERERLVELLEKGATIISTAAMNNKIVYILKL